MSGHDTGLRCYRCYAPAEPGQEFCDGCGLPLRWNVIHELFALDYLRMAVDRWARAGWLDASSASRLADDSFARTRQLLDQLTPPAAGTPPSPAEPPPPVPPPARPRPTPIVPAAADAGAPPPSPRPPARPRTERAPQPPRAPSRPVAEVLLDPATLKLMLYAGAVLLAVGVLVYLRDTLRVQLQRPEVQASLLGVATFGSLAVGFGLVRRARGRLEPLLVGRAFLFLGSLLLPVFFWFLARSGLVEDRGNAWLVTLTSFAVSATIALTLGERSFVYVAYAGAMATAWLGTFRVLGATGPGSYGVTLVAVSLLFLHAEVLAERTGRGRPWEHFGPALARCGHVGVLLGLVFYTNLVRLLRPEVLAAFRHFDATGYSAWIGAAVALAGAEAYAFSAVRARDGRLAHLSIACALWACALGLLANDARPEAWLLACSVAALLCVAGALAVTRRSFWGGPLARAGAALAWAAFALSTLAAVALCWGEAVRWHAAAGAAVGLVAFALSARDGDSVSAAFPLPVLGAFALAWALRAAGLEWSWTCLAVAAAATLGAPASAATAGRPGLARGAGLGLLAVTAFLGAGVVALVALGSGDKLSALPASAAVAAAFLAIGWVWRGLPAERLAIFGLAVLALQVAAAVLYAGAYDRRPIEASYTSFWFSPLASLHVAAWLALRGRAGGRPGELARAARGGMWVATVVAAAASIPLLAEAIFSDTTGYLWAAAFALMAAPALVLAWAHRGAGSIPEGAAGLVLGLVAFAGLVDGLARDAAPYGSVVAFAGLGLVPWLLAGAARVTRGRAAGIAVPAAVGGAVAAGTLSAAAGAIALGEVVSAGGPAHHGGHVLLAGLVGAFGLAASSRRRAPVWAVQFVPAMLAAAWEITRAVPSRDAGAVILLVSSLVWVGVAARMRDVGLAGTRAGALAVGHGWALVALATAAAARPAALPVDWAFVGLVAVYVATNVAGAAFAERDSDLDWRHRDVAVVAVAATAAAALHALGRTSPGAQAEPLALLLTVMLGAVLAARSAWAAADVPGVTAVLMALLVVANAPQALAVLRHAGGGALWDGGPVWSPAALGRFAALVGAYCSVWGAIRRSPAGPALAAAAVSVALLAFGDALGWGGSSKVIAFVAYSVGLLAVAGRAGSAGRAWIAEPARASGHLAFMLAAAAGLLVALGAVSGGTPGVPNPDLTAPVAMFAALAGGAWAASLLAPGEAGPAYRAAGLVFAAVTYAVLGLRLGFHPWTESAFYTLPAGAVLLAAGVAAARRGRAAAAPILWLGSVVAVAPMLLHALDDRFVAARPSFAYDAATVAVAIAVGAVGVLFRLKGPSAVAAAALGADLFVVAFSQVRWSEIHMAVYAIAVGGALFLSAWALIYRRERLDRFRAGLRERREAFERWR